MENKDYPPLGKDMTKKLPDFKNIDDMAAFWDTHDSTDYAAGEIEAVEYRPKRLVLSVRFDAGDMLAITREARRLGMEPLDLNPDGRKTVPRKKGKCKLKNRGKSFCLTGAFYSFSPFFYSFLCR
ncbi:MAG: CopG family antitoxin [Bacillota bacterium]